MFCIIRKHHKSGARDVQVVYFTHDENGVSDKHNPDINPHWTPLVKFRIYKCDKCGTE